MRLHTAILLHAVFDDILQLDVSKYKFYSNKLDIEVKVKLVIAEMYGREMLLHLKMNDVISIVLLFVAR